MHEAPSSAARVLYAPPLRGGSDGYGPPLKFLSPPFPLFHCGHIDRRWNLFSFCGCDWARGRAGVGPTKGRSPPPWSRLVGNTWLGQGSVKG